ncbi:hypothetical protein ILYODFUR_036803 [Ilyodon furcidens]|uniref:Uncharacterized protein n=1 Tax=Ilyodon furcidens TaxID=33524 RepID=A0ABV0T6K0_9TELE
MLHGGVADPDESSRNETEEFIPTNKGLHFSASLEKLTLGCLKRDSNKSFKFWSWNSGPHLYHHITAEGVMIDVFRIRISFIAKFVHTYKEFDSSTLCSLVIDFCIKEYTYIYNIQMYTYINKKVQHLYTVVWYSLKCSTKKQPGGRNCLCGGWF